ncbi:MAG: DUF4175 family protein [Alphaproteobacteria bacterium]|nr:DUF4175 family protein [Alphaproteobacteria bacterium]
MSVDPKFLQSENVNLARLQLISRTALLIERLGTAGWRLASWCMGFGALWLFEIPQGLGAVISVLTALIFVLGALFFIRKDVRTFHWPTRVEVQRRIEQVSGARHRPLSTLDDRPVQIGANALWAREQYRKIQMLAKLRSPTPRALLAAQDPRALRLGLLIALICGVIVAGADGKRRILSGLWPVNGLGLTERQAPEAAFWITPPKYTGQPRILPPEIYEVLHIPQGSIAKMIAPHSLLHSIRMPALLVDGKAYPFENGEDGAATLEMEIPVGHKLRLRTGLWSGRIWDYEFIEDLPPSIGITDDPRALENGQIQFALTMFDDYGVKTLHMRMTLDPSVGKAPMGWAAQEERSVLSPANTEFQMAPVYDLAAHPWAGLPVVFTFSAHDHLDQIAQTLPLRLQLPERSFSHPVARQLIEMRKYLIWNPDQPYGEAGLALENMLYQPHTYGHDLRVFLALRVAASRLYYNEPSEMVARNVIDLLWDIALRLEDGNLSLAARDLRELQKKLEQALQNHDASDAEIAMLMERLRQAMAEYIQALAREWQKSVQNGEMQPTQLPPEVLAQMMNMNDLAGLMDQMEQDMLSGDRTAAQKMLSKLQRLMDMAGPSKSFTMPPDMQIMQKAIKALQDLIERQEALRSQTTKQAELYEKLEGLGVEGRFEAQPPPFINTVVQHTEQEALHMMLKQLMEEAEAELGEIPENFELAAQAMANSGTQLEVRRPDLSLPFQDEAIKQLKESQQQMAQMMAQRMQQMTGLAFGGMPMQLDPLGRPYGGQDGENGPPFGSQVKIPSESERKWVQEILNELRRRASDRRRPQEELDYYRRLLKRF